MNIYFVTLIEVEFWSYIMEDNTVQNAVAYKRLNKSFKIFITTLNEGTQFFQAR